MRECLQCGDLCPPLAVHCPGCGWQLVTTAAAKTERRLARSTRPVRASRGNCTWCGKRMPCREHPGLDTELAEAYA